MDQQTPLWHVIRTANQMIFDNFGRSVNGKRVFYAIADGHQDFVDIPLEHYNAQTVQDAVHAAVLKHLQVKNLQGPTESQGLMQVLPPVDNVIR